MSTESFTKLFNSIITSSLWQESSETRIVFITMLALADWKGKVTGSVPGIAHLAHVPLEKAQEALAVLAGPDKFSRTKTDEGRRIREIDGGWQIINYEKKRNSRSTPERLEYQRTFMRLRNPKPAPGRVPESNEPHAPLVRRQTASFDPNLAQSGDETRTEGVLELTYPHEWFDEYGNEIKDSFRTPEFKEVLTEWYSYKDERKQSYCRIGSSNFVRALHAMPSVQVAVEAMRTAMANNWMGVHLPNEYRKQTQSAPPHVQLRILEEQISKHPANPASLRYVNGGATEELKRELARMRQRAEQIRTMIANQSIQQ